MAHRYIALLMALSVPIACGGGSLDPVVDDNDQGSPSNSERPRRTGTEQPRGNEQQPTHGNEQPPNNPQAPPDGRGSSSPTTPTPNPEPEPEPNNPDPNNPDPNESCEQGNCTGCQDQCEACVCALGEESTVCANFCE